jgi:hypothetical protein
VRDSTLPLDYPRLSVLQNDAGCELTVTGLVADGYANDAMLLNPKFAPPIRLSGSWANEASQLPLDGSSLVYGSAKVDTTDFAGDFALSIIVSDDPTVDQRAHSSAEGGARVSTVSSPNYALSMGDPTEKASLHISVDAARVVTSATGSAVLTDGTNPGDHYVISSADLPEGSQLGVGALSDVYDSGTEHAIDGPNARIPAAELELLGQDLSSPVIRTVIVSRTEHGVRSFQVLRVTFEGPV